jgi:hypothetical protein
MASIKSIKYSAQLPADVIVKIQAIRADVIASIPPSDSSADRKRSRTYTCNPSRKKLVNMNGGTAVDYEFPSIRALDQYIKGLKARRKLFVAKYRREPANGKCFYIKALV